MDGIVDFIRSLYTTEGLIALIRTGGLVALVAIVFAETGLLVGFFLPGDSLLVTAGILSSAESVGGGIFDPVVLATSLSIAAVAGDQVNFALGRKAGRAVYSRPDGRLIKRRHFEQAHAFYVARGGSAIVLARFVPILRTFVPFVAGVAEMPYRRFAAFNVVGGVLWVVGLVALGYFLGGTPLGAELHRVILVVVGVSLLPLAWSAYKVWREASRKGVEENRQGEP